MEAKALDTGCSQRFGAREMRGWYLLKAGATEDGEAVFGELLAERPRRRRASGPWDSASALCGTPAAESGYSLE